MPVNAMTRFFIPVADTEKILIDMVYYHEFLPLEVKNEILRNVNKKKLQEYILMLPDYMKKRVIAFAGIGESGIEAAPEWMRSRNRPMVNKWINVWLGYTNKPLWVFPEA